MEIWFANVLAGKYGEKEREFIQECFRKGDKEMISGFEQLMNEKEELAEKKGMEKGIKQEREHGIKALVETCRELGVTQEQTIDKLREKFSFTNDQARNYMQKYWNEADQAVSLS